MRKGAIWKLALSGLGIALIGAVVTVLVGEERVDLTFRELTSPAGFRELVLRNSPAHPIVASIAGRPGAIRQTLQRGEAPICELLINDPDSPTAGAVSADIDVVTFLDYRCPYCRTLAEIVDELAEGRRVRVVYKEWPILGEHSEFAARAALAAANQQKYREFHLKLMQSSFVPTADYVRHLARRHRLDVLMLLSDMKSDRTSAALGRSAQLASSLGLYGTPSLVVGRTIVHGTISSEQLERLVEHELKAAVKGTNPCRAE